MTVSIVALFGCSDGPRCAPPVGLYDCHYEIIYPGCGFDDEYTHQVFVDLSPPGGSWTLGRCLYTDSYGEDLCTTLRTGDCQNANGTSYLISWAVTNTVDDGSSFDATWTTDNYLADGSFDCQTVAAEVCVAVNP